MNIIVTGSTGFIEKTFINYLKKIKIKFMHFIIKLFLIKILKKLNLLNTN